MDEPRNVFEWQRIALDHFFASELLASQRDDVCRRSWGQIVLAIVVGLAVGHWWW
jgi:hypothetical protein